jgi:hypothetical protein
MEEGRISTCLNLPPDMKVWYSFDKAGYTDFPKYEISQRK